MVKSGASQTDFGRQQGSCKLGLPDDKTIKTKNLGTKMSVDHRILKWGSKETFFQIER